MHTLSDYETMRVTILRETGVSVCTRLHFGRTYADESQLYLRFAYSGMELAGIAEGRTRLTHFLETRGA